MSDQLPAVVYCKSCDHTHLVGTACWFAQPPAVGTHWAVTVERNGENVVTIASNSLSGRDLSAEDEDCIRNCAQHLLAFVGNPAPDPSVGTPRCTARTDVFGRCALVNGHNGKHQNALGEEFSVLESAVETPPSADDQTELVENHWVPYDRLQQLLTAEAELIRLRAELQIKSVERDAYIHTLELSHGLHTTLLIDLRALVEQWQERSRCAGKFSEWNPNAAQDLKDGAQGQWYAFDECATTLIARLSREPHQDNK